MAAVLVLLLQREKLQVLKEMQEMPLLWESRWHHIARDRKLPMYTYFFLRQVKCREEGVTVVFSTATCSGC